VAIVRAASLSVLPVLLPETLSAVNVLCSSQIPAALALHAVQMNAQHGPVVPDTSIRQAMVAWHATLAVLAHSSSRPAAQPPTLYVWTVIQRIQSLGGNALNALLPFVAL